jgi:mono/diheme cytochrome c family protein
MASRIGFFAVCCLSVVAPRHVQADSPQKALEFFEKSVRPVLVNHCFECHSPAKKKPKAGLRVDSREALLEGGESGPAIVAGKPADSLLIKVLHYKEKPMMPPNAQLSQAEIAALSKWVEMGAPWPKSGAEIRPVVKTGFQITPQDRAFWSFQPVADPPLPKIKDASWAKTTVDHFILAKLEQEKLRPAQAADRRQLIRRATFDLIGLPPTPEEIDGFVKDDSANAFAKVVDRLLASPHYGERWARHWLDVARYGEDQAHTFQARKYPQGFRYRDWLVKAFNDDMPYDRFLREQIAADVLAEPNRVENLPALGFFALGPVYYGDPKKLDQIDDRIDTLSRGLMGLTVACARCHDHKYDPISTKDYYSLAGIIAGTDYVEASVETGQPVVVPKADPKDKKKPAPPKGPFIHAVKEGTPVTMKVLLRGNPKMLGEDAPRRMMSILATESTPAFTKGSGRLELAVAIASKDNPLTARVMVNRLWQHHFGKGLVRTPSNFGVLGERPTHPELLDHLTTRFIASGWSVKTMHREMMLSAAYQMSSRFDAKNNESDADNKYLWRANRRRLEVEAWRDGMLAVAGKLDRTLGGPSGDLAAADNRRRTLYGSVSRHELNPLLRLFDFPDPNITSDERTVTTVPLQQLFVLNSEFLVNNAKALAVRLATGGQNDSDRIRTAFVLLYGRPVTERELQLGLTFLSGRGAGGQGNPGLTRWEQYTQVLLSTNEFMYVD